MNVIVQESASIRHHPSVVLGIISLAELFALSIWFSASAIVPELEKQWNTNSFWGGWITGAVQVGFVVGALISASYSLADRFNPRKLFAAAALMGSLANGLFIFCDGMAVGLVLRFFTGIALAGVYPVAVKLVSLWFPRGRGLAIGILIGSLTMGSALPHFIVAFMSDFNWKWIIAVSTILAFISSAIMLLVLPDPPAQAKSASAISWKMLTKVIRNKPVMLANYGYFGHMWELYAMWTWIPSFLYASMLPSYHAQDAILIGTTVSFLVIGVSGAIGCILGGWFADRFGRTLSTMISMAISGSCALIIGFTYQQSFFITMIVAVIWGVFVIADSAQFSAAVTEVSEPEYMGTALTFQMAIGFLITVLSINLISVLPDFIGWKWTFSTLAIGPLFGIVSMLKLRRHPEATKLANGRR